VQAFVFIAGAIVLGVAGHLLRRPPSKGLRLALAAFVLGLGGAALGVRLMAENAGVDRATEYDQIVSAALAKAKTIEGPYVLFVGSSHSRNGINDVYLADQLRQRGFETTVVNMSMQGASYQERDMQLQRFIKAAGKAPDVVFLEVSQMYDENPTYAFQVAKFSDRAIAQMHPAAVGWALIGLAKDYRLGVVSRVKDAALLGLHAVLNIFNVGLLHTAEAPGVAAPLPSYAPEDKPKQILNPHDRSVNLTRSGNVTGEETVWAAGFRRVQEEKLKAEGVRKVAYYLPPVTDPDARAFVKEFCEEQLNRHVCIAPTDSKLLRELNGEFWFDHEHLLRNGASLYGDWLAAEIAKSGVLK
jgi:hypothetical protein